jgi:ribose transport system permease protein
VTALRRLLSGERSSRPRAREHQLARRLLDRADAWALLALSLLIIVFFSVLPSTADTFPTGANFRAIASSQAVVAVATLAVLVPLICEEIDLSVGANVGLCSVLCASVMSAGSGLVLAVVVGVGTGVCVGLITGLLVTRLRIAAVVVTLGTTTILHGIVQAKTSGVSIFNGISPVLVEFGSGQTLGVPTILLAVLVIALAVYYLLAHTPLGRYLEMLGSNREAARLVGLAPERLIVLSFIVGGALAGMAGVLQVANAGSADPNAGPALLLPALAAAFLSVAAIRPGRYNVGGAITAIAFLALLNGGLNLAGARPYVADFVNGAALIAGVALAVFLGARRETSRR